jgi:hypothetical protein
MADFLVPKQGLGSGLGLIDGIPDGCGGELQDGRLCCDAESEMRLDVAGITCTGEPSNTPTATTC